jgi:AraC-like DNA-binding protein/quercetin dioxygenase-like cupin family protein
MHTKSAPPYDPRVAAYEEETRMFEETVFHFLSLEDRRQWMQSALLNDLRVFQVGYFKKSHGHAVERKNLNEGVLIYCVAGKGSYTQKTTTLEVVPGNLLYCYPRTHHRYEANEKEPWSIHWMHLSGPRMGLYKRLIGFTEDSPIVNLGIHIDIIDLFKSLYTLYRPSNDEARIASMHACAEHILASVALARRPSSKSPAWEHEIQSVMNYMETSVDKMMRLEDFSEYLGLSRFHFSRQFKCLAGVSPMRYFMHLKMKKACFLLESSSLKIKAIAERLGFENEYYFSRCFKASVGCSPKSYCKNS